MSMVAKPSVAKRTINRLGLLLKLTVFLLMIAIIATVMLFYRGNGHQLTDQTVASLAEQFSRHVTSANVQWQVSGRPNRILLIERESLDNNQRHRISKRPVKMNHLGWPTSQLNDKGCRVLWRRIMGQDLVLTPQSLNGVVIIEARYMAIKSEAGELLPGCQYRINASQGFDYDSSNGQVVLAR